jgi:hypothetical protein
MSRRFADWSAWRPLSAIHGLRGTWTPVRRPLSAIHGLRGTWTPIRRRQGWLPWQDARADLRAFWTSPRQLKSIGWGRSVCPHLRVAPARHDCRDAGGTSPWMDEVEPRREQRSRATHGAVAETASLPSPGRSPSASKAMDGRERPPTRLDLRADRSVTPAWTCSEHP